MEIAGKIKRTILVGLVTVFPVLATAYFIFWAASGFERFFGNILRTVLPENLYNPGFGIAAGIFLLFLVGLMMRLWFMRHVINKLENAIYRLPFIKSIYGSLRELVAFLTTGKEKGPLQVVAVTFGEPGIQVIGLMTRTDLSTLSTELGPERVAVYMPMSYQLGGYTVLVSRQQIQPLNIPLEKAMRFVVSAGIIEGSGAGCPDRK